MIYKNLIFQSLLNGLQFFYRMNNSLSEIQADIQRLANQQNQIQQQHLMTQHQQQMQQQLQQLQSLSQQHMQVCIIFEFLILIYFILM